MSADVYQMITDRLIAELESGIIPWSRPWTGGPDGPFSGATGRPYSLLNQMLLRKAGAWFTFQECQRRGGHVRRGEKASFVVFWKPVKVSESDAKTGEVVEKLAEQYGRSAGVPNPSGKLRRGSLRYHEVVELADALGYDLVRQKRKERR